MASVVELERAIARMNGAIANESSRNRDSVLAEDVGKVAFTEILSRILRNLEKVQSDLAKIPTEHPDLSMFADVLSAIRDIPTDIPDNSGEFSSIRDEIKKLASFVLENQREPAEQPSVEVDLSEITNKIDMILSKPTPQQKIIEKLVEKKSEKKEWEFMVRRDQNGLIQKIEAIEV